MAVRWPRPLWMDFPRTFVGAWTAWAGWGKEGENERLPLTLMMPKVSSSLHSVVKERSLVTTPSSLSLLHSGPASPQGRPPTAPAHHLHVGPDSASRAGVRTLGVHLPAAQVRAGRGARPHGDADQDLVPESARKGQAHRKGPPGSPVQVLGLRAGSSFRRRRAHGGRPSISCGGLLPRLLLPFALRLGLRRSRPRARSSSADAELAAPSPFPARVQGGLVATIVPLRPISRYVQVIQLVINKDLHWNSNCNLLLLLSRIFNGDLRGRKCPLKWKIRL